MHVRRVLTWVAVGMSLSHGTGCTSTHPIRSWQQGLTTYTMREAGGDLNILRESAQLRSTEDIRPAEIRFDHTDIAQAGLPPFVDRKDANGVLVGQVVHAAKPTFFFLVGVIERPFSGQMSEIEDIRLVSCTLHNGKHHWKTSRPDGEALNSYRNDSRGADRANPDSGGHLFPLVDDQFDFEVSGSTARVRDARSGASWELPLD